MSLSGNKGEWSEVYVLLKLVAEKKLYLGDENLNKIEDAFYEILEILRGQNDEVVRYEYDSDDSLIVKIHTSQDVSEAKIDDFNDYAVKLYTSIMESGKGSLEFSYITAFLEKIKCIKIKAASKDKSDINIKIFDAKSAVTPTLGFSIKSQLGGKSTLFNSTVNTSFTYKIINASFEEEQIEEINSKKFFKDKISKIEELGGSLCYDSVEDKMFKRNLLVIDSKLDEIFAWLIFQYYKGKGRNLVALLKVLNKENPLLFELDGEEDPFYNYKIKRFLSDCALGMLPSKRWEGVYQATGGYIIVKRNGDIVCYHFYYKNEFENYLLHNTEFETPSTSKHDYGYIYKKDNNYYIKLNMQIRFTV